MAPDGDVDRKIQQLEELATSLQAQANSLFETATNLRRLLDLEEGQSR